MPNAIIHAPASLVQNATMHAKAVGLRPRDRFLLAIPCYFSYGFVAGILGAIIADADIVMTDYPMLPIMWHGIVRSNAITVFSATPSLFRKLFAEGRFPASLRMVTLGGDATSSADLKSLWQVFDGTVHLTCGLSEAGPRVFTRTLSHGETDAGAVGEPFEGVNACLDQAVIAEDGRHVGELLLRTPTAMLGTYDGEQIIRNNFRDGWLATGDRFAMAPDTGKLYFIDRLRNIIACGGEKLSAGLIRRVVLDHPEVVSARIEARPDDALGAAPVATVRFRDGCALTTGEVLTAWCLKHLRRIEVPRSFCIDPELPISHK